MTSPSSHPPGSHTAQRSQGTWLRVLHALVYAGATFVGVSTLSPAPLPTWAAAAAAAGVLVASSPVVARLRLPVYGAVAALGLLLGALLPEGLRQADFLADGLGASGLLILARGTQWVLWSLTFAFCLRGLSLRVPALRALELAMVGVSCAQPLVGHRGGAINRPFELSDAVLASGNDPTLVFLMIGAMVAALVVVLLIAERRPGLALLQVLLVGLLLALFASLPPLPQPDASTLLPPGNDSGGKPRDAKGQGRGEGQDAERAHKDEELNFQDDYDGGGKQTPLAVVLLHSDYSPPAGMYYFRQAAFSQFNGRRLVSATRSDVDRDVASRFATRDTEVGAMAAESPLRTEIESSVALLAEHTRPFALETLVGLSPAQNPDPRRFRRVYRARSAALAVELGDLLELAAMNRSWSSEVRDHYLQAPDDARYATLAQEILQTLPAPLRSLPVARGLAVSRWLSEHGIYSLKSQHAAAEDPAADFLFGDLTGYCVHFAYAAVYLMRALDVPARVATGYLFEESARQGGSAILLTGANAHAWPEIHVDGAGWVVVDVAPEQALDSPPPPPDPDLQRLLGELARGMRPLPAVADNAFTPVVSVVTALAEAFTLAVRVGLPVILLGLYLLKVFRRFRPRFARPERLARAAYRAQLDRLAELSVRRRYGESREAFAQRLQDTLPGFQTLTTWHIADRYRPDQHPPRRTEVADALARTAAQVAAQVPAWRRLLGWLDPVGFLLAR